MAKMLLLISRFNLKFYIYIWIFIKLVYGMPEIEFGRSVNTVRQIYLLLDTRIQNLEFNERCEILDIL